jgi:hypothetical protein
MGFLLGVVGSLLFLFLAIFLSSTLGLRRGWTGPVFEGIALVLAGAISLKNFRRSNFAAGMTIAFSLALLLDVIYAYFG